MGCTKDASANILGFMEIILHMPRIYETPIMILRPKQMSPVFAATKCSCQLDPDSFWLVPPLYIYVR
jgi:hypothetical protein